MSNAVSKPRVVVHPPRLTALTGLSSDDLHDILGTAEGLTPLVPETLPAVSTRQGLFIRLCLVRLAHAGLGDIALADAALFLWSVLAPTGSLATASWLLRSAGRFELVTTRPYLIDAVARCAGQGIIILDIAALWAETAF